MGKTTSYTYDSKGNLLTRTQPNLTYTYSYDAIYRLTQATPTGSNPPETYTYDQVGNRLTNANEQPPTANETVLYSYDDENRLTGVQITSSNKTKQLSFSYDPLGRRISKTLIKDEIGTDCTAPNVCPRTTTYVYDNRSIILEYNSSNEVITRYTHGPGIDEPLAIELKSGATYTPYFYHADGLGSITALSNAEGTIIQSYTYDTFGNMAVTTQGNVQQPYTFTAREYDPETGMYFYRARYYDPKAGRFVTKDPIGFAGGDVNFYAMVNNNPVIFFDPLGLDATNWNNITGGRSRFNGPTNGNWGGRCWSGGQYSCDGQGPGNATPTDSADQCYKRHDECYMARGDNNPVCNRTLVDELRQLPDDPRQWPSPPRTGTEGDSRRYRDWAIRYFR